MMALCAAELNTGNESYPFTRRTSPVGGFTSASVKRHGHLNLSYGDTTMKTIKTLVLLLIALGGASTASWAGGRPFCNPE
jgi:hypothetical protein